MTDYRELEVYKRAFALQQRVFNVSKRFPKSEAYSLTDQARRSSRSVGANIAEAWKKRRYQKHFVSKLTDADAELAETQHWIRTAHACDYLSADAGQALGDEATQIGRMIGAMIRDASSWCISPSESRRRTTP